MNILVSLLLFCGGLWLIIKGGDYLVTSALSLNRITGINQVIIGATFVSVATTLPEVFVSIFAVVSGNHGIAMGNAIGSMICNVALVLALYITFMPGKIKRREIVNKSLFLIIVTIIVFLLAMDFKFTWLESVLLISGFILFLVFNISDAKKRESDFEDCACGVLTEQKQITREEKKKATKEIVLGFLVGQIMLIIGAFIIVQHGEHLAQVFGISDTVVGFTAIAVGTSMPELITAIASIRRKGGGLALGNVLGANIINCTLLLGVCGFIGDLKGMALPISKDTLYISIPVLFLFTLIAIIPMLTRGKTFRWQGISLLGLYLMYVMYLVVVQPI
jgi:cation:H+ antiporter